MRRRSLTLTLLILVLASVASAVTDFTVDDQFRKAHARADIFAGKPVIMLAGMERKTPDAMEAWDRALHAKALPSVRVVGLSNLEGVPFFATRERRTHNASKRRESGRPRGWSTAGSTP